MGNQSGITVDGGDSGAGVDGYVEGAKITADNDGDGSTSSFGDSSTSTSPTGVFKLYGASGPLIMSGGTDKVTGYLLCTVWIKPAIKRLSIL